MVKGVIESVGVMCREKRRREGAKLEEVTLEVVSHVLPTFSPNICKDRHLIFDMSFSRTLRAMERRP